MTNAVSLSPVFNGQQFFDQNGEPLAGGLIYTYAAGSFSSVQTTYSEVTGTTPNSNPIVLDSSGRINTEIWLLVNDAYNLVLTDASSTIITNLDNVNSPGGLSASSGASLVGFLQAGTGAVATNLQTKLREYKSVFDFMTAAQITDALSGSPSIDATDSFNAALLASAYVFVPAGTYKVDGTISAQQNNNVLFGVGAASILNFSTSGTCINIGSFQYCGLGYFALNSTTAEIGVDIGFAGHWFLLDRLLINGASSSTPTGFTTAAIRITTAFYGNVTKCDIAYAKSHGVLGTNQCNGNFITCNSIRQCEVGIEINDTTSTSDGNMIVSNEIETAAVGSVTGIAFIGGTSNVASANRLECSVGTSHIVIAGGVGAANYHVLRDNMCRGTNAAVVLGTGSSVGVTSPLLSGGQGGQITINSDVADAKIDYAGSAYYPTPTNAGVRTALTLLGSQSFAAGISGLTTSPTAYFLYSISDGVATVSIQTLNGTSNSTSIHILNWPTIITPTGITKVCLVPVQNNGAYVQGTIAIASTGTVILSVGLLGNTDGTFTSSGGAGILNCTISYAMY